MEHRTHARSNLRLPVFLMRVNSEILIRTETENVSNDGFFAFTKCAFLPGERVRFLLLLPDSSAHAQSAAAVAVYGDMQVIRVTATAGSLQYGIGCQLTNYRVLTDAGAITGEALVSSVLSKGLGGVFR